MLERKDYIIDVEDIFGDVENACEEVVSTYDNSKYLCDLISEVADSYIPIYNKDLCDKCWELNEYVEEAKFQGLLEGAKDLFDMLKWGAYEYYTQMLNDCLDEIKFNIVYDYISREYPDMIDKLEDDELEELLLEYDHNDTINDIQNAVYEFLEEREDQEEDEDEE